LAGGGSSRFGRDKALAEIDGKPMLLHMRGLLANVTGSVNVVATPGKYSNLGVSAITDRWPGEGPLGGIITALRATEKNRNGAEWNLLVGCDMPFLTGEWLAYLVERSLASPAEVVVPQSANGLEPLCACWRRSGAETLQRAFDNGVRKVTEAMRQLPMEIIDESDWKRFDSAGRLFWNMNTAADYDEAKKILKAERA
jgi:molybdopterin-guanine dinucleotide biosynthesis protein A